MVGLLVSRSVVSRLARSRFVDGTDRVFCNAGPGEAVMEGDRGVRRRIWRCERFAVDRTSNEKGEVLGAVLEAPVVGIEEPKRPSGDNMSTSHDQKRGIFEEEAIPYLDALYHLALRMAGDPALADDLVQETMLKAYRAWDQYRPGSNIRAWLFTILRNTLISEYRRRRNRAETVDLDETDGHTVFDQVQEIDPSASFFDQLVDGEVARAIDSLPEEFREALVLSDIEGLPYQEIAEIVGVPVGTVKSRLHRARRALQRQLYCYAVEMGYIRGDAARCAEAGA